MATRKKMRLLMKLYDEDVEERAKKIAEEKYIPIIESHLRSIATQMEIINELEAANVELRKKAKKK